MELPHFFSTHFSVLDSLLRCLISLRTNSRKLNFLNKLFNNSWSSSRKSKKFESDNFNWFNGTSSFASMEVSNQFKLVFKFMDTNGDGKLSPLELSEILLSLGQEKSLATKEAEGMVREMDCDGDGLVDLDEFMTTVMGSENELVVNYKIEEDDDDLFQAFLIFDSDKNGFISEKELQRVLINLGLRKNCSLRECRKMIKGVDRDGDGSVNFEEFKSMMGSGGFKN